MLKKVLTVLTLLGMATASSAQSIGSGSSSIPLELPFVRKFSNAPAEPILVPSGEPVVEPLPEVAPPHTLKPTKHPYSFIWSNTEEFFNRPVLFNQPVDPVKTAPWFWFRADYLLWKIKDGPLPVLLVTTGDTPNGLPLAIPMVILGPGNGGGVLGNADTQPVFGLQTFEYDAFSGLRFEGGLWCDCDGNWSVQIGGFFTEESTERFDRASTANGAPLLARPFFDPVTGREGSVLISAPGAYDGSIRIRSHSRFSGAEANLRRGFAGGFTAPILLLAGFRYVNLDEDLTVFQQTKELDNGQATFAGAPVPKNAVINLFDSFSATNRFYGGQLGVAGNWQFGSFILGAAGKAAIGGTVADLNVAGVSRLDRSNLNLSSDVELGGVLAQPTNIHSVERTRFSFVGEVNVSLSYLICSCCRVSVGYDLLYWSDVVRPGNLVDRHINSDALVVSPSYGGGGAQGRPERRSSWSDFWAQGFNLGLEVRY